MMNRLCFISRNYRGTSSAGNKAKTDYEQILRDMGATNLGLETTFSTSQVVSFVRNLMGIIHMSSKVQKGDIIVLQYPVKKYFSLICRIAHRRGAKTIALIHDLGCMRRKKLTEQEEISRLMHADGVIATNAVMMQWLKEKGYTKTLDYLGLHDYLSDSVSRPPVQHSPLKVVYAGTLALRKNAFLMDMAKQVGNYELVIYGKHKGLPRLQTRGHIKVNPFLSADTFIREVEGDFGLVWDGDSLDTCSGHFGEYLRWNTPHKVSFYIRAGLPMIVWRQSAVAPIVQQEGIGFCIDSIEELNTLLPSITPQQLSEMRQRVAIVSSRMAQGCYLKEAVGRILQTMRT
jgi:glycosyltransferase involved in cell wall biosynthesis